MRRATAYALLIICLSSTAVAGQVYGTIFLNNQPLSGVPVTLSCPGEETGNSTDSSGVYRLYVKTTGSCTLILEPRGRNARGSLYSYDRPTEYDFDLVDQGNGQSALVPHKR
jgi:hypothetical protein